MSDSQPPLGVADFAALDARLAAVTAERDGARQALRDQLRDWEAAETQHRERLATVEAERDAAYESRAHWCLEAGRALHARDALRAQLQAAQALAAAVHAWGVCGRNVEGSQRQEARARVDLEVALQAFERAGQRDEVQDGK